eukprot:1214997-Rhodomonas_salina.1
MMTVPWRTAHQVGEHFHHFKETNLYYRPKAVNAPVLNTAGTGELKQAGLFNTTFKQCRLSSREVVAFQAHEHTISSHRSDFPSRDVLNYHSSTDTITRCSSLQGSWYDPIERKPGNPGTQYLHRTTPVLLYQEFLETNFALGTN